uniref:Uncharacterized protein n=1 Tax=Ditylenchus dipsaci TaxID=166011 RepID=A0A915DGT8_9BILA
MKYLREIQRYYLNNLQVHHLLARPSKNANQLGRGGRYETFGLLFICSLHNSVYIQAGCRWLHDIYVTPLVHTQSSVDISLTIREYNEQRTKVFDYTLRRQNSRSTSKFSVQLSPGSKSPNTMWKYIGVRALPLTHEGSLYQGDVQFQLWFGDWKVVAIARNSAMKFDSLIRVNEYTLPKYRVFFDSRENQRLPFIVKASVLPGSPTVWSSMVALYCAVLSLPNVTVVMLDTMHLLGNC